MGQTERDIILVPTDFSEVAHFAMDHAAEIARIFNHKICLLHIVSKKQMVGQVQQKLQDISAKLAGKTKLDVSYLVEVGTIFKTISQVADRLRAEFIIIGIHGKKGVQHIVGSYAYRVVDSANVPVLLVKNLHFHEGYHNIVVPIDFSKESDQKVHQAIRFARYFDATIRVFGFLSTRNPARIFKKEALLKRIKDYFDLHKVKVTSQLLVDPEVDWASALMKYSTEVDADLVMIVAEKGGSLMDAFSENTTERIIDKIDIPVLTVCRECSDDESGKQEKSLFKTFIDPMDVIQKKKK